MPLPFRVVEPIHVSRGTLPERFRVRNELEAAANGSLANVIRQLSSLSQNAEEIFADLINVGTEIASRASNLQARIDRLAVKVIQMDSLPEEASMQDALNTKPFQSSMVFDQQVVVRQSLPLGMSKIYQVCDRPPPLDKLNRYRDDGKDGLKFYTDPSYFFELWRQDMLKDTERAIYDRVKKPHKPKHEHGARHKKRVRQPHSTRDRHRYVAMEHGEHIMADMNHHAGVREAPDGMYSPEMMNHQHLQAARPNSIDFKNMNDQGYNGEVNMEYRNQLQAHQNHYEAYNGQHAQMNHQRYYSHTVSSPPPPYESPASYARQTSTPRSVGSVNHGTPQANGYAFRPSQPPPAPPPAYIGTPPSSLSGTPTRSMRALNSRDRETLPPPPPPPVEQMQNGYEITPQMNGHGQEYYQHTTVQYSVHQAYQGNINMLPPPMIDDNDEPLPPPPPTPDQHMTALAMAISHLHSPVSPEEHLPPSPPPPPPEEQPDAPPPPPPPPPPIIANGNVVDGHSPLAGIGKSATETITVSKRQAPAGVALWDVRSELLKAIRSGIELRKVDKKESGKEDKTASTYHDVASILARRVAVEMSDSESGSDSEYDSDVWGDETSA